MGHKVTKERQAWLEQQAPKDLVEQQAQRVPKVPKALKVLKVHRARRVQKVQ